MLVLLLTAPHPRVLPLAAQAPAPQTITISIVGTNDLHGGMLPRDGNGGLALLGGYMKNLRAARAREGGAVLLIDGGDMFQGTLESNLSEGAPVVAAYNVLGYTAAAVGNHEFDFGPAGPDSTPSRTGDDPRGALKARAAEARFPFLAANLLDSSSGRPVDWPNVKPSVLVDAAGIKIGIVGVMTRQALSATIAANTRGLGIAPLAGAIAAQASQLRSNGASLVLVTAHAGGRCSVFDRPTDLSSCEPSSEILELARELPRGMVDLIVAGHTHAAIAHQVGDVPIIESYSGGRAFGRVDVVIDRTSGTVASRRIFSPRAVCSREDPVTHSCDPSTAGGTLVPAQYEGLPVTPDPAVSAVLAPALDRVRELKARAIGVVLETPIRRQGGVESPLGNLFTDALRQSVPEADVAVHNIFGGLRADLPQGPLTYGSVYEAMPFDNRVVQLRLTGAELKRVVTTHLQRGRRIFGVSGIRVRAQCSGGTLDAALLRPSGRPIADDEKLAVVTVDFLATGGDGIFTPVTPPQGFVFPDDAPLARDVFAEQLRKRGGRVRQEDLIDLANPRWTYPGTLPVTCRG
jgi:2',3'-cyclic-nucleotide 2'-phosphodiesterase (5'-nucleotidase family)